MDLLTVLEEATEEIEKASSQLQAAIAKTSEALQFTETKLGINPNYDNIMNRLLDARAAVRKRHARLEQILSIIGVD